MKSDFQRTTEKENKLSGVREIVALGDMGCTGFDDRSKAVFADILRQRNDLFLITGDLTLNGAADQFAEVIGFCNAQARAPVFALCGNHDVAGYAESCGLGCYAIVWKRPGR